MYFKNINGRQVFTGGQDSWSMAKEAAENCSDFKLDVEYELVADDKRSCYNCRYRKWTNKSFICLKK